MFFPACPFKWMRKCAQGFVSRGHHGVQGFVLRGYHGHTSLSQETDPTWNWSLFSSVVLAASVVRFGINKRRIQCCKWSRQLPLGAACKQRKFLCNPWTVYRCTSAVAGFHQRVTCSHEPQQLKRLTRIYSSCWWKSDVVAFHTEEVIRVKCIASCVVSYFCDDL